jgi:hypothetical protein
MSIDSKPLIERLGSTLQESNRRELPMEPSKEVFVSTGEEYVNDRRIFKKLVNWVKKGKMSR